MIKRPWVITVLLVALAFVLRFYHFEARAPFDWDQNRDYGEVVKIAAGEYLPLGPIAKGTGGFYLGSLYYYLLYPTYFFLHGALTALPLTSLMIDALVAGFIYLLLHKTLGKERSLLLALLWATSWFLIDSSRISWNVSLVPLWSLFTLYSLYEVIQHKSSRHLYLLAFLSGLSIHIHVTTIPIIPLLLLFFWKRVSFSVSIWLKAIVVGLVPAIPLAVYDLSHSFFNLHLLRDFITYHSKVNTPLVQMVPIVLTKLGKVVSGLFISEFRDNLLLGVVVVSLAIKGVFTNHSLSRLAGATVLISTSSIILFRDYGFPEYYFALSYLSLFILTLKILPRVALYLLIGILLLLNIHDYTTVSTGYSLAVKTEIINSLQSIEEPIDLNYSFDPGRDGGLRYLAKLNGLTLDSHSKTRILLTDKLNTPLYIDGELARDLIQIGNIKTALYIVQ